MKDKITIGKDFNTAYSFVDATRVITLENMPDDLTSIIQVLYVYNVTQDTVYYIPTSPYSGKVTVSGINEITLDASYSTLSTGDELHIIISVKNLSYDEDLNSLLVIPQARVPKEKTQFVTVLSTTDICTTDGVSIRHFDLDVREYSEVALLCKFVKNDSQGGKILINGHTEYSGTDIYEELDISDGEFNLPTATKNFVLRYDTSGLNYISVSTVATSAIGSGSNEDTISISVGFKPL